MGLQQVSEMPPTLPNEGSLLLFGAILFRLFQSQAKPVRGVGGYGDRALPFGDLTAELPKLGLFALNYRTPVAQGA